MPLVILGAGAGLVAYFLANKPEARKRSKPFRGVLVEVVRAKSSSPRVELKTHGRVRAAQRVVVTAQVSGVVNWISPILEEGKFFQEGDLLLTLDPQNRANLDYTLVKAPFNGVVQTRNVDPGQNVNNGAQLAVLIGSDHAEVISNVPVGRLELIMPPETSGSENAPNQYGIAARVTMKVASETAVWEGRAERHLLELTPNGMMVQLILSVEDPFRLQPPVDSAIIERGTSNKSSTERGTLNPSSSRMPLFIGAFVDVSIPGKTLENIIELPIQSLRNENTVWIVKGDTLEIRPVKIAHLEEDSFFVAKGLDAGEQVVVSPLKGAANGLKVQIPDSGEKMKQEYQKISSSRETKKNISLTKGGSKKKKWKSENVQPERRKGQGKKEPDERRRGRLGKKKEEA